MYIFFALNFCDKTIDFSAKMQNDYLRMAS